MPHKNIEDRRAYRLKWHHKNRAKCVAGIQKRKKQLKKWVWEYKRKRGCSRCPENHPACLDFHHNKGDKEFLVSRMANQGYSKPRILEEIKKCIILCSNCHRKEHFPTLV